MVREDAARGCGTALSTPLDWGRVERALHGRKIGGRIVYHASTGSTNDDAKVLASVGEPEGTVVVADEQIAGRGRAGKSRWVTPANTSVAVSVLLRPKLASERLGALAMIAGLAAIEAVERGAGVKASLKWPNDVLVGGSKLGGILVESALSGAGIAYAVVGTGLNGNLRAADLGALADAALPPTTLRDATGQPVDRERVVISLLEALDRQYRALNANQHAEIADAYRAALATLGQAVTVTGAGETIDGIAEDVNEDGALVLRLPSGARRALAYGEVTVRTR